MLKINIDKNSIKMSICGDVITISSEIASIINHIYESLNSNDKDNACKFKDCIKKIVEDDVVFMNDKERDEYALDLKRVDENDENEEEDIKEILSWLYNPQLHGDEDQ